jgi:hypothetical protein
VQGRTAIAGAGVTGRSVALSTMIPNDALSRFSRGRGGCCALSQQKSDTSDLPL